MKKIKGLLIAFVALFAFTLALVTVKAEGELAWNVDTDDNATEEIKNSNDVVLGNGYLAGSLIFEDDNVAVAANKNLIKTANKSTAAAESPDENTFAYALVGTGGNNSKGNAALKVTSKVAGATIGIYYTLTDGNFASKDQSKGGALKVFAEDASDLKEFDSVAGSNKVAYYSEYTINAAETDVYIGTSANRLAVMGLTVSVAAPKESFEVTIKNVEEEVLATKSVTDGDKLTFTPAVYGFDFVGYYTDAELTSAYNVNAAVTEALELYAKFTPWTINIKENELSAEHVSKLYNTFNSFESDLVLANTGFTILNGCLMQQSSKVDCIGTASAVATDKNAIKFVAQEAGQLSVSLTSAGGSARDAKVIDASENEVSVSSGNHVWTAAQAAAYEVRTLTYDLEAGAYFIGGTNGMRIFSMEFTPTPVTPTPTYSVNLYQFGGFAGDTEVVRYVGIVEGYSYEAVNGSYTLVLNCDLFENGTFEITEYCTVVDHLTLGGDTFTAEVEGEQYEFGVKDNVLYVVCVVAVANDGNGLANQYAGHEITATLSVPIISFNQTTPAYTVQGQE